MTAPLDDAALDARDRHLRDQRERFIFQGGSVFANELADAIAALRSRIRELESILNERQQYPDKGYWMVECEQARVRAERAEAELARVTGERDAAVKDAERWCVLKQMVGHPHDKTHLWELRQFTKGQWLWCSSDLMDERVDAFIAAAEGRNG